MIFFLKPFLFSLALTFHSNLFQPNVIVTNIVHHPESFSFTSNLNKVYDIKSSHIIYIGNKYALPMTSISMNQLIEDSLDTLQCNSNPFYKNYLIGNKDYDSICKIENKIANIIDTIIQSNEKYMFIFDDNFWLQDDSFYRLLQEKKISRILQLDLNQDNLDVYPFFTDKIIYYWSNFNHI